MRKIVAITTDPYDNIYGYSLVFIRLFEYIQRKRKNLNVYLISNDGASSTFVGNNNFIKIKLNPNLNILFKTIILVCQFVRYTLSFDNNSIIISNSEIPELIVAFFGKIKFKKVYCIVQDLEVRGNSLKARIAHFLRIFLIKKIGNVIFTNNYTVEQIKGNMNKYYIGNPVFF